MLALNRLFRSLSENSMRQSVLTLILIVFYYLVLTEVSIAHVRWFTDPDDPSLSTFPVYSLTDLPVLAWFGIGFVLVSNIVFLFTNNNEGALIELVGHMPIIATAIILILLGYGQRLKLKNPTLSMIVK